MRPQLRLFLTASAFIAALFVVIALADAQPGGGKKGGKGNTETVDEFVKKVMAFNKAKDGKLTKTELTDTRLHGLFDRADANKDGMVTREELEALFARETIADDGKKGKGPKGPPPDKK